MMKNTFRTIEYIIPPEYHEKKVIHFLRSRVLLSARLVNTLKRVPNGITLNGKHIRTIDRLSEGDVLEICIPETGDPAEPVPIPLDIVFEDEDVLVINKPAGLAMHPTHNHQGDTLANAVSAHLLSKGKTAPFRAVGRLDKGTSGLVVCALNKHSAGRLSGRVTKTYLAVAEGVFEGEGTIDVPIFRPNSMKTLRACGETGDRAVTHWKSLISKNGISLLRISLQTGRTHQIRVHFAHLGSPLAGDDMYGGRLKTGRQLLHCESCSFLHPISGEALSFFAPMPEDFKNLIGVYESKIGE